jgi:hypothetical protein
MLAIFKEKNSQRRAVTASLVWLVSAAGRVASVISDVLQPG